MTTDTIARTIAALREFPVAVAAELYRLAPGRKPPNGDDILVLCDAAEASLRATNEIERAYQILEVNGVPRDRARNIANGIDVLVTRMERGLRSPPREPMPAGAHLRCERCGNERTLTFSYAEAPLSAAPINEGGQDRVPGSEPVSESARDTATIPVPPSPDAPAYTTGHCEENAKLGGCQMPNVHCGWPECDRRPAPIQPSPDAPAPLGDSYCPSCKLLHADARGNCRCQAAPPSPDAALVERLRGAYSTVFERSLAREAADAIERLTAELAEARRERDEAISLRKLAHTAKTRAEESELRCAQEFDEARAECERLRAALKAARAVMGGEGVEDQGEAWDKCLGILEVAIDAGRGK